jgi:DNA-binding transcriptional LysR family regulator
MPRVKTEIVVDLGNTLRDSLENGKVDLILSTILPTDADKFVAYPFAQDEVVVVASRNHPLVGKPCGLADLLHYNWALPGPNVATRQWVEWAFKSRGLRSPEVQIETSSLQVLPTLIAGTTVLGFTPRSNLGPGRVASQLVELQCEEVTMSRQLGMLHRKTGTLSPVLRRILALAKDVTRSDRLDAALAHRA